MNHRLPLALVLCLLGLAFTSTPAAAQADFSGTWGARYQEDFPERIPGPELGDYLGLPITDGARQFAESWDSSRIGLTEEQCRVHVAPYIYRGPLNVRIWEERDPRTQQLIAIKHHISTYDQTRTIYMDGRPHPGPFARHTWMGFSTGRWEGNMLVVTTTHLKFGWHRRNGLPMSDQATLTEFFARGDNIMTRISVTHDPVYLSEPLVKSEDFTLSTVSQAPQSFMYQCKPVVELADRPLGYVPAFQLGENPFIQEFINRHGVPDLARRGGAETMYPEFVVRMAAAGNAWQPPVTSTLPRREAPAPPRPTGIEIVPAQGGIYMLVGPRGNSAVHVGEQGVILVDTQPAEFADDVFAAIRTLSPDPIHYVINTSVHDEAAGGNEAFATLGPTRKDADAPGAGIGGNTGGATVMLAHENVLARMAADGLDRTTSDAWPAETYFGERTELFFNNEAVQVYHPAQAAITDGDSIVFFRRSDVIAAGDIFLTTHYPFIDAARGGHVNGIIDGLNLIIDLAVPDHHIQENGTLIVPGDGRLSDEQDVIEYRDMLTIIRDRIQHMIANGATLDQVKAARPTLDFDARYGSNSGPWTTDLFVETIYRNLSQ
jgi:glyoxylase-like metal-dependent hydrolase (beta-lactamase superfamily II)